MSANTHIVEFGDFQTPNTLARLACERLRKEVTSPELVVEPTCGTGNFLRASLSVWAECDEFIGLDINPEYISSAKESTSDSDTMRVRLECTDFFTVDWRSVFASKGRVVVLGNPPWVTSAALGQIGSSNLPTKTNLHNFSGLDAITGKSNFDISEWMIIKLMESAKAVDLTIGFLCKTSVARKSLSYGWRHGLHITQSKMIKFDAKRHFG